jgi:ATP-dependent DNA ligase
MGFVLKPELLTEVPYSSLPKFISDDRYGIEEKYNGKRRTVVRDGNNVFSYSKDGGVRTLPARLVGRILSHPMPRFVIDCELMVDETLKTFDAIILDDDLLGGDEYIERHKKLKLAFNKISWIEVAHLAVGTIEKTAFVQKLIEENAEGIVLRKLDAVYQQGDSRQHKKIKFWRICDCVVISVGQNEKESARVGVWHKDRLIEVCGVSLIGKIQPVVGDVVEVKCLYSTPDLHLVQPGLLGIRDDKASRQCTSDQLAKILNKNWINSKNAHLHLSKSR